MKYCGVELVMIRESPWVAIIIASVAMNAGIFMYETRNPTNMPTRAPITRVSRIAAGSGSPRCADVPSTASSTENSVIPVPTERSMPPVAITKFVPSARIPVTEAARRIPEMLEIVRKFGVAMKNARNSSRSAPSRANFWSSSPRRGRPGVAVAVPELVATLD